jgi:hypothetical protein
MIRNLIRNCTETDTEERAAAAAVGDWAYVLFFSLQFQLKQTKL